MIKNALSSADLVVKQAMEQVTQQTIFNNPSAHQLASHLVGLVGRSANSAEPSHARSSTMDLMISQYTQDLHVRPDFLAWPETDSNPMEGVVLTGTTGALGSHLLAQLLMNNKVRQVWAINRLHKGSLPSTKQRQIASFEDKLLPVELLDHSKLKFLDCDLNENRLGLFADDYEEASDSCNSSSNQTNP